MDSCSVPPETQYDVFLSFRGTDTRDTFTSFLYEALCRKKIETYIDYRLERGDEISPALLKAIEESSIAVVIFSKNYASSSWCLDELVHILYCRETNKQVVIPVFYEIDPSNVWEQTGSYADAFMELEERFDDSKLEEWRAALKTAANLSGEFDSQVIRPGAKLVKEIVEDILKKLGHISSDDLIGLVGIEKHIRQIESLLCKDLREVRTIIIWGMGGIGKTTIAGAVYNRISSQFDGYSFVANVREETEKQGLIKLRNNLLAELLGDGSLNISTPSLGSSFVTKRLRRKRFLIVLDDVNSPSQLKCLAGEQHQFGAGSRIIVTTRDVQVLRKGVNIIYEVEELNFDEALELFQMHALDENSSLDKYLDLSKSVVKYANGVPLALVVLGSYLFGRSKEVWESALVKLRQIPHDEIQNVLKISYDGLEPDQREIFLDLACFYKGKSIASVERILDGCGFSAKIEIDTFVKRSLIAIKKNKLWMHDLLQNMGREIVRQESRDVPGNRSRLWIAKDVYDVLKTNTGTEAIKGMFVDMSKIEKIHLSPMAFSNMRNLRLLKIYTTGSINECKLLLDEGLQLLPYSLRYVHWHGYPLNHLPLNFDLMNLVELNMPYSQVKELWDGVQDLPCLRKINLSYSKQLTLIPNLSKAQNLQYINLQCCTHLLEVPSYFQNLDRLTTLNFTDCRRIKNLPDIKGDMEHIHLSGTMIQKLPLSIGHLDKLISLTLKNCQGLKYLPSSTCMLNSLQNLNLSGCSSFHELSDLPKNIRELDLSETLIQAVPLSIECLFHLQKLSLEDCEMLESLPPSICKLKFLEYLSLSGCSSLEKFPEISEPMECLKLLNLSETAIIELPLSVDNLTGLQTLYLLVCENLEFVPGSICNLNHLETLCFSFSKLEKLPPLSMGLCSLSILELRSCNILEMPDQLDCLSSLERLILCGNAIRAIPTSIKQLYKLNYLDISNCTSLQFLPELPLFLEFLDAHGCSSLEIVSSSRAELTQGWDHFRTGHEQLIFLNCLKLDENSCNTMISDSHLRILRMAAVSYSRNGEVQYESSVSICCPGHEIPNWFSYQTAGPSINIKLSPHWRSNSFLGFSLCVVASIDHYCFDRDLTFQCHSGFKTDDGESHNSKCRLRGWPWYSEENTRVLNSDYVFLWYEYGMYLRAAEDAFTELSFDFQPLDALGRTVDSCVVKSCGMGLLHMEDVYGVIGEDVGEPKCEEPSGGGISSCNKEEDELHR